MYENVCKKMYARKSAGCVGKTWFLPHQIVLNPKVKIRVAFGCSSQYEGISINQDLLAGLDVIN